MNWIILSIGAAFLWALNTVFLNKFKKIKPDILGSVQLAVMVPVCALLLFILDINIFDISLKIFFIMALLSVSNLFMFVITTKAIHLSGLGLTQPFLSLTPIFLIFTSFLFFKETPTIFGLAGIILIVLGAYLINIRKYRQGIFEPFKEVFREKGSVLMLIVAFVYSINANLFRIGAENLSRIDFVILLILLEGTAGFLYVFFKYNRKITKKINLKPDLLKFLGLGFLIFFSEMLFAAAIIETKVSYAISLKRTQILFSVIFGYVFFKEKNFKETLFGSAIMVAGVVVISLFG
ncbi:EamA family transporter [Candidatus Woesearchaeota archaeon]|nr:EamA family transporter [Candidatus Woesearchaeota archaeon]